MKSAKLKRKATNSFRLGGNSWQLAIVFFTSSTFLVDADRSAEKSETQTIVDIGFFFDPWPAWFFVQTIFDWNWIWTNTNIVININNLCGPGGGPPIVSDIRLKRDIALLERLPSGIGLYRYRYVWSNQVYVGVMAQ